MHAGREKRSKPVKKKARAVADEEPELVGPSKRDRFLKKSGRNKSDLDESWPSPQPSRPDEEGEASSAVPRSQRRGGMAAAVHVGTEVFMGWEEVLGSRELLRRRLVAISAVHGWEARSGRKTFLGGIAPGALIESLRSEVAELDAAAELASKAEVLLELRQARAALEALSEEREQAADDLAALRDEHFEVRDLLGRQGDELEKLRTLVRAAQPTGDASAGAAAGGASGEAEAASAALPGAAGAAPFQAVLSREDLPGGRRCVEALARLKLPDEASMAPRELACWHENKRTIENSLKTLSGQIYSARARIVYEIIQNADDCSYDAESGEPPQLHIECSDEALCSWHNERGFQPKDLYAMCQVGESSKPAGSGKIGRKGIGFKSVFQISDAPMLVSPPFQFCFDTVARGIFGYIVPSWVDAPADFVPPRLRPLLCGLVGGAGSGGAVGRTGTLLVCPFAPSAERNLLRGLQFDGLALAFLKNLKQIRLVSTGGGGSAQSSSGGAAAGGRGGGEESRPDGPSSHEYRVERATVSEEIEPMAGGFGGVLKGIGVRSHTLCTCTIIESAQSASGAVRETRKHFRLHSYSVLKYKADADRAGAAAAAATTTVCLAFPVGSDQTPRRSDEGELVFAYLPVTAAGFGFAIQADFELVASRQDVSEHSGNHVLLGRIPGLFVHAVLSDPALGEDAFPCYLPDLTAIRKDRSGGGRKWCTLASALHRATESFMTVRTEDDDRVRRRHAVLRPRHLSCALVPNGVLKAVSDKSFAHADEEVDLVGCLEACPVGVVLDCLRKVFQEIEEAQPERTAEALPQAWRYLSAEYAAAREQRQGAAGQNEEEGGALGAIVEALVGGTDPSSPPPLRIFPVRGSSTLRLHSEHGAPLCWGLSPSLTQHGASLLRLADRIVPQLDLERIRGARTADGGDVVDVDAVEALMRHLRVREATHAELEQQLKTCFRFGLAVTVEPDLWWDAYKYAESLGHARGLADFVDGAAVALPVSDSRVVSSRDVRRLSVSLPCLLGLRRKHSSSAKSTLALPPSAAATWGGLLRWELAMATAFGVTFPQADAERMPLESLSSLAHELIDAVVDARCQGDLAALSALSRLLEVYEERLGGFLANLKRAMCTSYYPERSLLEPRAADWRGRGRLPFDATCSPRYIEELMAFAMVADDASSDLLETRLTLLRLQEERGEPGEGYESAAEELGSDEEEGQATKAGDAASSAEGAETTEVEDEAAPTTADEGAVDEAVWSVLHHLLGFRHVFAPRDSTWVLYGALQLEGDSRSHPAIHASGTPLEPLVTSLARAALTAPSTSDASSGAGGCAPTLWPCICCAGGVWVGSEFVLLRQCVWDVSDLVVWGALQRVGCRDGRIVELRRALSSFLHEAHPQQELWEEHGMLAPRDVLAHLGECCMHGRSSQPPLPYPAAIDMMLGEVLPWLLARDGTSDDDSNSVTTQLEEPFDDEEGDSQAASDESSIGSSCSALGVSEAAGRERPVYAASEESIACYSAVLASSSAASRSKAWAVPVPTAAGTRQKVVLTAKEGRAARSEERLIVLPDAAHWPVATAHVLQHFAADCLHPTLAPTFAFMLMAGRRGGLETPCARIQRSFHRSLRLAAQGGEDEVWALVTELYERPAASAAPSIRAIPALFSPNDHWEVLLWAAITCATEWHRTQSSDAMEDASRYHETLSRTRRLVPFVERLLGGGERWSFLDERDREPESAAAPEPLASDESFPGGRNRPAGEWRFPAAPSSESGGGSSSSTPPPLAAEASPPAAPRPAVLLLGTLFGYDLFGSLRGLELRGSPPTSTAFVPSRILASACAVRRRLRAGDVLRGPSSASPRLSRGGSSFPEAFERESLMLLWEWFCLEVAGAAPPAVLWATVQETIGERTRPRIRTAMAALQRGVARGSLEEALLDSVRTHTQIESLMEEMDARDEARNAARERERRARNAEREARLREARLREAQRQLERREQQQLERDREAERQDARRAERMARARGAPDDQPPPTTRGEEPLLPRASGSREQRVQEERARQGLLTPDEQRQAQQEAARLRRLVDAQRSEIERMRAEQEAEAEHRQHDAAVATAALENLGVAGTFRRMLFAGGGFGGGFGGGEGGGAPAVQRRPATLRESEVKAKLARFLAGMRALERQRAASAQPPLPPIMNQFIVWAGDLLAGGGRGEGVQDAAGVEAAARRYVGGAAGASGTASAGASASVDDSDGDEDDCCICQEGLSDSKANDEYGEPLETGCGHRFHVVCLARHLEASTSSGQDQEPVCPMCRSTNLSVSFRPLTRPVG